MLPSPSFNSSGWLDITRSSNISSSWDFSDHGVGTSVDQNTNSEASSHENFEQQICDLHILRQKLLDLEKRKQNILQEIQYDELNFNQRRLEAEKTMLLTSLKTQLLLAQFKQKYESQNNNTLCNIGSVTLQGLKLHYNNKSHIKKYQHYFLCTLSCGPTLFSSQISEADTENIVHFNINHTFLNLPVDFEISVKIYILKVKKKNVYTRLRKKFLCWPLLKSDNSVLEDNNWRRESMFKFWKETVINISNVNEITEVFLELVNSKLCKIVVDVNASTDVSTFSYSGWADVSRNGLFWNQRWCMLEGTLLKCFNYPVDNFYNNAVTTIDLSSCSSVRIAGPYQESRSKVIILEMDDDLKNPFYFYLSTNSNYEFNQWKILEKIVPTLQAWKNTSIG